MNLQSANEGYISENPAPYSEQHGFNKGDSVPHG